MIKNCKMFFCKSSKECTAYSTCPSAGFIPHQQCGCSMCVHYIANGTGDPGTCAMSYYYTEDEMGD